jgi:hypothetical protein
METGSRVSVAVLCIGSSFDWGRTMMSKRDLLVLGVVVVVVAVALRADEGQRPKGVFAALRLGQSVSIKDMGSAFSITVFDPELPQSHKVIEIGDNFIVVRDIAEVTDTTIPIYSVKAIVKVKASKQ